MRIEEVVFTVQYKMFDVGEKVKATSTRCVLDMDKVYIVTECIPAYYPGDNSIVFVEGRETGIDTEYVTSV